MQWCTLSPYSHPSKIKEGCLLTNDTDSRFPVNIFLDDGMMARAMDHVKGILQRLDAARYSCSSWEDILVHNKASMLKL